MCFGSLGLTALCCVLLQETIEKTDAQGKLLPEMVSEEGGRGGRSVTLPALPAATAAAAGSSMAPLLVASSIPLPPPPPLLPLPRCSPQILICQNLRNNLQHPNEYIRGVTLRFLCRIHEEELLEPLVPSGAALLLEQRLQRQQRRWSMPIVLRAQDG